MTWKTQCTARSHVSERASYRELTVVITVKRRHYFHQFKCYAGPTSVRLKHSLCKRSPNTDQLLTYTYLKYKHTKLFIKNLIIKEIKKIETVFLTF